jgi:hypothetical protein
MGEVWLHTRPDDIWQERLYAIQWAKRESLAKNRQETFFASVNEDDQARERKVEAVVRDNLAHGNTRVWCPISRSNPGSRQPASTANVGGLIGTISLIRASCFRLPLIHHTDAQLLNAQSTFPSLPISSLDCVQ